MIDPEELLETQYAQLLDRADRFVRVHAATDKQRHGLEEVLAQARRVIENSPVPPSRKPLYTAQLPVLVYGCIRGKTKRALPLGVAALFYGIGVSILDDVMDGDPPRYLPSANDLGSAVLIGVTFAGGLAPRALLDVRAPMKKRLKLHERFLSTSLRVGAGQLLDLEIANGEIPTPEVAEECAVQKTGLGAELLCELAARLAKADAETVERYATVGRGLGTARQLQNDLDGLRESQRTSDLARGGKTLAVALHAHDLEGDQRQDFVAVLERARTDPGFQTAVRARLQHSGSLREAEESVARWRGTALAALTAAQPNDPACSALKRLIEPD
jgi:geranylgeranyl pyrophosphate synthase